MQSALPDPEDDPTRRTQTTSDSAVTLCISSKLRRPERDSAFWRAPMTGTPVPKTAIYKHCNAFAREHEVGSAGEPHATPPAANSRCPKELNHP